MLSVLLSVLLVSCSDDPQWHTSAVASGFPDLEFELVADNGEVISEASVHGTVTLLFFGYTFCPDVCPTTLTTLRAAIEELPASQRERVSVLFVSVDPQRDDPKRLAAYTGAFGPQFIGATAGIERLKRLTNRYGSDFEYGSREDADHYLVSHGSSVLAFDGEGRARLLIGPDDNVKAIAHDLRQLLSS